MRRTAERLPALAAVALLLAPATARSGEPPIFGDPTPLGELVPGSGYASVSSDEEMDIASGGGILLAVWREISEGGSVLRALRLSPDGAPLDAAPMELAAAGYSPRVAHDGTRFLVVWQERADGATSDYWRVLGLRIGVDGPILDAAPLVVCDHDTGTTSPSPDPSVAGVGGRFLVAWTDARSSADFPDIYGVRIDGATGAVDEPGGFVVADEEVALGAVQVASDGIGFLAVWEQDESDPTYPDEDIVAAAVSPEYGTVSAPVTVCGVAWEASFQPLVAGGPGGYLVVWADERETGGYWGDAWGTLVDGASMTVVTPDGALYGEGDPSMASAPRDVVAVGADFAVLLRDVGCPTPVFDDLRLILVGGADGLPAEVAPCPVWGVDSARARSIAAVSDDVIAVLGARSYSPRSQAIVGRVDLAAGASLDPGGIHLSPGINHQFSIDAAAGESSALVAWADTRGIAEGASSDVYAQRIVRDGTALAPLDAAPIRVSSDTETEIDPVVASAGGRFLVAWRARANPADAGDPCAYGIRAARIDEETGALLDSEPLLLAGADAGREAPVAAGLDGRFLIAWADADENAILGAMVDAASGEVDDFGGAPLFDTAAGYSLALAAGREAFWLAWSDWRNATWYWVDGGYLFPDCQATMQIDLFGGRVDAATGEVAEPDGVPLVESWEDKDRAQLLPGPDGMWTWWREYTEVTVLCFGEYVGAYSAIAPIDGLYDLPTLPAASWPIENPRELATTGAELFSVWSPGSGIWYAARHLGVDGSQLDDPPLTPPIPAAVWRIEHHVVVGDSNGYLIFWDGPDEAEDTYRLFGAAVQLPECAIGDETFPSGAEPDPDGCLRCVPAIDATAWTPLPAGTPCDDGDAATENDRCDAEGACVGTPVEPDGGADGDSDSDSDGDSDSDAGADTDSSGDGGAAPDASAPDVSAASPGCECTAAGVPRPTPRSLRALFETIF